MIKIKYFILIILFFSGNSLSTYAESNSSIHQLVGLAVQEKLRTPIFYAAIYAKNHSKESDLFDPKTPVRMISRFKVNRFSSRQNQRYWMESISVNTPKEQLDRISTALKKFSLLMKVPLIKGDHLVFDYVPKKGTTLLINGVVIGKIKDPKFQSALISAWLGKSPSSKSFGDSIRKKPDSSLMSEFINIRYTAERVKQLRKVYDNKKPS